MSLQAQKNFNAFDDSAGAVCNYSTRKPGCGTSNPDYPALNDLKRRGNTYKTLATISFVAGGIDRGRRRGAVDPGSVDSLSRRSRGGASRSGERVGRPWCRSSWRGDGWPRRRREVLGGRARLECARPSALSAGCSAPGLLLLAGCPEPKSVTCPSGRVCPSPYTCAADQDICILGNCGNGVRDTGEACDDGNKINNDGCNRDCTSDNSCGNGHRRQRSTPWSRRGRTRSATTAGLNGQPGHCSVDCKSSGLCGNGIRDNGEDCDYCIAEDASIDDGSATPPRTAPRMRRWRRRRRCQRRRRRQSAGGAGGAPTCLRAGDHASRASATTTARPPVAVTARSTTPLASSATTAASRRPATSTAPSRRAATARSTAPPSTSATCSGGADTANCNGTAAAVGRASPASSRSAATATSTAPPARACDVLGGADTKDCNGAGGRPAWPASRGLRRRLRQRGGGRDLRRAGRRRHQRLQRRGGRGVACHVARRAATATSTAPPARAARSGRAAPTPTTCNGFIAGLACMHRRHLRRRLRQRRRGRDLRGQRRAAPTPSTATGPAPARSSATSQLAATATSTPSAGETCEVGVVRRRHGELQRHRGAGGLAVAGGELR